ncbi:hypothetical protein ACFQ4C_01635 [Larkinella insperata]|uniref:YcgL domain-containing protein n=1 Tax=Larkinella insperata TaxID=332158 RepID=A0ABW3Q5R6_9BACT|nr:hypothetical protein [Larkinella insperata]
MVTYIYQSQNQPDWYLVLPYGREDDFSRLPADVLSELGELVKINSPDEGPGSLGIDLLQAKNDFDILGYHVAKPKIQ